VQHKITLKNLDDFGISSYEAKSYLSLLEKNQLTASEVSHLAGIPRAKVYEVLGHLEAKGLCRAVPGKIKMYTAVEPSLFKEVLIQSEQEKLDERISKFKENIQREQEEFSEKIKSVEDLAEKLAPIYEKGRTNEDRIDYIELIKQPAQLQKRICQLIEGAEKEVVAFSKTPLRQDRRRVLEQLDLERESLNKGVLGMCIYEMPPQLEQMEWLIEYLEIVSGLGEQVRVMEELPIKMLIFDVKTVVFQLEDPISFMPSMTSQVIQHKSLAKSLRMLFETTWERAKTVEELEAEIYRLRRGK
jgi:sugar-specific transcriptional regulator TrmB